MLDRLLSEIRTFCERSADPSIVAKYARYFKEGFDGYGIDTQAFEAQRDRWLEQWKGSMTLNAYLDLGDRLMKEGRFEEMGFAIHFVAAQRPHFTPAAFDRVGRWFESGLRNWGSTDALCMLVLSGFLNDGVVGLEALRAWTSAPSEWQRRAVAVTLVELVRKGLKPDDALPVIEPLMLDGSEYVQKGVGTLLRGLWKKHPAAIERFLLEWKDRCGRLIVQYATEKMDKEDRKRFKRASA